MIAILAALVLSATPAAAPVSQNLTDAELSDRVDAYLRTIDEPVTPDEWRALGPKAIPLLEGIAADPRALPTTRAQALWALIYLEGARASQVLRRAAQEESLPLSVRLAGVRGLAAVTPPETLEQTLRPVLEGANDARVRAVAAERLVKNGTGNSCELVRARAAVEDANGKALLAPAIEACGAR